MIPARFNWGNNIKAELDDCDYKLFYKLKIETNDGLKRKLEKNIRDCNDNNLKKIFSGIYSGNIDKIVDAISII